MRLRMILPVFGLLALAACGDDAANQTGSTNNAGGASNTTTAPATPSNNSPTGTAPATPTTPAAPRP